MVARIQNLYLFLAGLLAIVKDIINMHKGDISVESEQDKGTKFTVTLPKDLRT